MNNLEPLCCTIIPRAGGQSVSKAASIPFIVHDAKEDLTQNGNYSVGHCPHVSTICLPDVITHDHISQAFPTVFVYCK